MKSIRIIGAILPVFLALPSHGALLAGARPKEWPASPDHHKITIAREAADENEKKLIAAAEKSLPDAAALAKSVAKDDSGLAKPQAGAWWNKEVLGIRIPYALTADAVQYYSDLVKGYGLQKLVRFSQPTSGFTYQAKVARHAAYEIDGKSVENVTVVTMTMKFHQNFVASVAEGFQFEKSRTVVFDKDGKILQVKGDGDTEVPVFSI